MRRAQIAGRHLNASHDQNHQQAAGHAYQRIRSQLRQAARLEAERWGWAGATEQLRAYYRQVLERRPMALAA